MNQSAYWLLFILPIVVQAQRVENPKLAKAQAEYRQALMQHDTMAMAEAAYLMGKRFRASGDYVSGRKWFLYALRIQEPLGPSVSLNKLYVQLVGEDVMMKNFPEATMYARRALANSRRLNHPHSLMSAYQVMSGLYRQYALEKPLDPLMRVSVDSAFWYVEQAELIALQLNDEKDIASTRRMKAQFLAQRSPHLAIPLLVYTLTVYQRHKMYVNCVTLHIELADSYVATNQLPLAQYHLLGAEKLAKTMNPIDVDVPTALEYGWANWHRAMGHWQQAYLYLHRADSLRQQTLTTQQRTTLANLNVLHETDRRENFLRIQQAELALRANNLRVQQQYTYAALALLLLTGGFGTIYYRLNKINKRISLQNAQLVREQSHRMHNNLQAISGLLSLQSNRLADTDAKRAIEESQSRVQIMALLNRKLYDTNHLVALGLSTLIPDVVGSILRSYGYSTIQPDYELSEVPLRTDQAIPIALIINELVTNACKYAFPDNPNPTLQVRCWQEDGNLRLQVKDNGPGLPMSNRQIGFGMHLITIQVRQLKGSHVFSGPPGLTFDLTI